MMKEKLFHQSAFFCILPLALLPFLPVGALIPAGLSMTWKVFLMIVPLQCLLLGATLVPSVLCQVKLPLRLPDREDIRYLGFTLLLFIGISLLNGVITAVFRKMGIPAADQAIVQFALHCSWSVFALLLVSSVILAPIAEELAFRYSVYGFLRQNGMGEKHAAVVSSLFFALMHGLLQQSIGLFVLGWFLQRTAESDNGRVTRPILMHGLFNLCGMSAAALCRILGTAL